jgi:branched-subunit amino acid transport protein
MRRLIYFIVLIVSITPVLTYILEKNYIAAIVYGLFFMFILHPFIKRFMTISNYD